MQYKTGEILNVYFPYSEKQGGKIRPALVLEDKGSYIIISKITSKQKKQKWGVVIYPGEHNGLMCSSVIEVDKTIKLSQDKITNSFPIGILDEQELLSVFAKIKEYHEERKGRRDE